MFLIIKVYAAINVRIVNGVSDGVVVENFKGTTLDAGLQIEQVPTAQFTFFVGRPVGVNQITCVTSVPIKEIEVKALSRFGKELNKGMSDPCRRFA